MPRPRVLCMVDLSGALEGVEQLASVANLERREPDRDFLLENIGAYDAVWVHTNLRLDSQILSRADRLRVINTASTGTDHIDVEEAARRGIRVLSITRDYALLDTFTATAECAWMLLLACHRHLRAATRHVLEGCWKGEQFSGCQLAHETLGVVGVGRLGKMVCEYGKAFRMRVLGCDRRPFKLEGVEQVDFKTLLNHSHAITVHIHLSPENHNLFDDDAFHQMRDQAILVNTSRGAIIDEEALIRALSSKKLAAFGTDVLKDEWREDVSTSPVVRYAKDHENVIVTPHIGGATHHSIWEARNFSARKLAHYLKTGEELTKE